jgi:hypothetical protein
MKYKRENASQLSGLWKKQMTLSNASCEPTKDYCGSKQMTDQAYCDKIRVIENLLKGNGHEGYFDKVDNHEEFIQQVKGALVFIGFIGLANVITLIFAILKLANR